MPVGSAGLSAYHAAWHATDDSGPRLAGLQLADGSAVLEEASLIVEGDHIAGPITSGRMPPTLRWSICEEPKAGRFTARRVTQTLMTSYPAPRHPLVQRGVLGDSVPHRSAPSSRPS